MNGDLAKALGNYIFLVCIVVQIGLKFIFKKVIFYLKSFALAIN